MLLRVMFSKKVTGRLAQRTNRFPGSMNKVVTARRKRGKANQDDAVQMENVSPRPRVIERVRARDAINHLLINVL